MPGSRWAHFFKKIEKSQSPGRASAETPKTIDQQLEELGQKILVLERKVELAAEADAEKAKAAGSAVNARTASR